VSHTHVTIGFVDLARVLSHNTLRNLGSQLSDDGRASLVELGEEWEMDGYMELQHTHEFIADGEALRETVHSVPAKIIGSYPALEPGPVKCRVIPTTRDLPPAFGDPSNILRPMQLRGRTHDGNDLWISGFRIESMPGSQQFWDGNGDLLIKGDLRQFDPARGKTTCTAFIPPTPIGVDLTRYDGLLKITGEERLRIRWNSEMGMAELAYKPSVSQTGRIGLDQASVRIFRCQIIIEIEAGQLDSLAAILSRVEEALADSLWLLSLLSRRRLDWYEARAEFVPLEESGGSVGTSHISAIARRDPWLGYGSMLGAATSLSNVLIQPSALKEGLFQSLLSNYESSPHKDAIRQTIGLLLSTYEKGYFEAHLGAVYSALEGLVHRLGKESGIDFLLGSYRFKKLRKELERVIHVAVDDRNVAEGIVRKLPELQRRAYVDLVLQLLEIHEVNLGDWWAPWADVGAQLKEIMGRRNVYIHQGSIDGPYLYQFDLYRLQTLVELWVLKLLGCPDSAINAHAHSKSRDAMFRPHL
jgi:hypothetical protein